jgi:AraC-like DNA-binding protein
MQEASSENPGSNIVVNRLAEVLFIHAIRAYIINNKEEKGFMAALKDGKISKALKLIHVAPEKNWTLNSLSSEAGLSRTLFANRFRDMVGETPLAYITSWRILKAKQMLEQTDEPVGMIAEKVGYSSEAAFNRVFKKRVSQTPGVYRREVS